VKVVEDDVGSGVRNRCIVRELLKHKLPYLVRVSNGNVNNEVLGATKE
jgi:hypothetical protein